MKTRPARLRILVAALALAGAATAVAVGAAAAAATAAAPRPPATARATASSAPLVINCLGHGQIRPHRYVLTCADGNDYLTGLHWASWGSAGFGSGSSAFNDCTPSCVSGHFHSFPVLVVLWRARPWPGHPGERYFTRVTLIYPGKRTYRAGGRAHRLPATSTSPLSASGGL
jgi:hypothetical protein